MKILNYEVKSYPVYGEILPSIVLVGVLTEGAIGDQAVYVGILPYDEIRFGDKEQAGLNWVASMGHKLRFSEALAYFPTLDKDNYRR